MSRALVVPGNDPSIASAAKLILDGKLVAFPTETVYGLGADATNDRAVASVYEVKGRPQFNPLIVHAAEKSAFDDIVEWSDIANLLAGQFWPGPLTLVLPRKKSAQVSYLVSAGMETLAVRVPAHAVAQKFLKAVNRPVAAPSANKSGKLSPTTAQHVVESLGDKISMILAGGKSRVGVESTVLDLTSSVPVLLRPGGITREQLLPFLINLKEHNPDLKSNESQSEANLSPGMLASHYAPNLPLRMNAEEALQSEALLAFGSDRLIKGGAVRMNLSESGDLNEAAANLFLMLRVLDTNDYSGIAVMKIPETGLGVAINDRLLRASHR